MPEGVEREADLTLRDVGPVLEVTLPGGRRAHLRLSKVDCPVLLKAVIGWVTDVLDPCELAGRMIERAYTAPLEGASMVETLDTEIEPEYDERAAGEALAVQDERARQAAQRKFFADQAQQLAEQQARDDEARERAEIGDKAQARIWAIFNSPSRIKRARERNLRYQMEVEAPNHRLRIERDQVIREAVAEITAKITGEYHAAIEQNKQTFANRERKRR